MPPNPPWDPAAEARRLDALGEVEKIQSRITSLTGEQLENLKLWSAGYTKVRDAIANVRNERQRLIDIAKAHVGIIEDELKATVQVEVRLNKKIELSNAIIEHKKKEIELAKDPTKRRQLEGEIKLEEKRKQRIGESIGAAKEMGNTMADAFKIKEAKSFTAGLSKLAKVAGGSADAFRLLGLSFIKAIPVVLIANMVGLTLAAFNAEKQFMKTTGASEKFAKGVTRSYEATRQFGVSMEEASQSAAALYETFTDFTFLAPEIQDDLVKTGALLQEQGVSFTSYAGGIQTATKALGVASGDADDMMMRLTAHARDIQVPVGAMVEQFASVAPELAALGEAGEKAFKDLARVQKITGFEMQKLLQLTSKFDTFEDAATMAGGLNAALGGNFVNAMDMMMETDPVRRFEMIRDAILSTGLSFENMHYYQRKFYAEQLGFGGDVSKLAMLMSGNMEALDGDIGKTAASYEEMQQRAAAVQSIQESLQNLLRAFVPILKPMIESLTELLPKIHKWTEENKGVAGHAIKFVTILWALVKAFGALGALFTGTGGLLGFTALFTGGAAAIAAGTVPVWGMVYALGALAGAAAWLYHTLNKEGSLSVAAWLGGEEDGSLAVGAKKSSDSVKKTTSAFKGLAPALTDVADAQSKYDTARSDGIYNNTTVNNNGGPPATRVTKLEFPDPSQILEWLRGQIREISVKEIIGAEGRAGLRGIGVL